MAAAADSVLERVRDSGLVEPGAPLIALVSGGRDSVCLLDVLVRLGAAVAVLHVNYGLRGAESEADERHVRALCSALPVKLTVRRAAGGAPRPGNLQSWARDLRYGAAAELAAAEDALIATGHTASDQAETILYRLAASPGRRALLGMARRDGRLVRPLLSLTREETAAYCRERGLGWREDASNADERFARARVRHGLLEELRAVHPAAEANVVRSAELLRAEAAALDALVASVLVGRSAVETAELRALDPAIARLVALRLAEDAAGRPVPDAANRLSELLELGRRGGTAELHLAGAVARVEYGSLRFAPTLPGGRPTARAPVALSVPGSVAFGGWSLSARLTAAAVAPESAPGAGLLDADAIDLERLTVRGWRAGDRLRPAGGAGSRTLADLFTDRRVPRDERPLVPLVESAGVIVWVAGIGASAHAAAGAATRRVALLTATRG
ncbi:MAG TPA: tRNA lysidine(34) synthetase TilS [Solirubrobacteraceae bacterium]|nr:tRNA lysidine(34) synthetase TilS [Solirubrobacteraceae bacterium]